ncbi:F0F1 ATP synthase subunit B [Paenibacillus thermoaerophilus]|uniref:ATP synthase subunit b n=1 Tax=Paenibacillus thermoaerophilus TaxID=1215385 RepID=A0ABW2V7U1_9BACL|nr:F0F1 ATP synthase subunit B [Paenibacillus thermoaerophilus]TMV12479.1 F0F1 ATP synthase subunit B [Paenibacillus thermoaerophilus]
MSFYWTSTVYAIIAFVILYVLLNKYAFGPLFGIMEKRRELVKSQLDEAERSRREASELLAQQQQAIQAARQEAKEIVEQARATSVKQADELIRVAKEEANRLKTDAAKEIENEKNKAIADLKSQVGELSVQIASKIIEKQLDAKGQEELVDKYLKEVGERA